MERRSRDKQKEVAAAMSSEEDDPGRVLKDQDDDVRQYRCYKKYEEIVKQVYA